MVLFAYRWCMLLTKISVTTVSSVVRLLFCASEQATVI